MKPIDNFPFYRYNYDNFTVTEAYHMALFKRNDPAQESDQPPRNPNNAVMFRLLAVGYVIYLCVQMIQTYTAGGPDAPSLGMLIFGVGLLGTGAACLGILSYKEWKRNKEKYDAYMDEVKAEAKAAREAEEAEAARLQAEDEYYEALEAAEAEEDEESEE